MRALITGAGGFVGRALVQQLLADDYAELVLVDTQLPNYWANGQRITRVEGALQNPDVRALALAGGIDCMYHLAAVPGGAAEAEPGLSKQVNLDATLALIDEAARAAIKPRIVFTSTIAVLGAPMPAQVDDSSPVVPSMTYGAHKAMVELALADYSRRGLIDAISVRLPGIVARPPAASGLKSAFLSNVFHALKANEPFVSPVSPQATMWLMSVVRCAANLVHAGKVDSKLLPVSRAVTLPALRTTMAELVAAIAAVTGRSETLVSYRPDEALEASFGRQPPLATPAAERAGFIHDGTLRELVARALDNETAATQLLAADSIPH